MAQHMSGPPSLAGQVALITGGSGGMGRAIAKVFDGAGARVVATDLSKHEDLGRGIEYRRYDVTSRAETDQVIDAVLADHGKVDILVLCAGIIARTPLSTSTDEEWNSMLSVNVLGVVNPARKLFRSCVSAASARSWRRARSRPRTAAWRRALPMSRPSRQCTA
jgi:3-oxoacyl-[acyl-carrier protein] reductase